VKQKLLDALRGRDGSDRLDPPMSAPPRGS
jgi:hypothetical protein